MKEVVRSVSDIQLPYGKVLLVLIITDTGTMTKVSGVSSATTNTLGVTQDRNSIDVYYLSWKIKRTRYLIYGDKRR